MVPALPEAVITPLAVSVGPGRNAPAPRAAAGAGKHPGAAGFSGELDRAFQRGEDAPAAPGAAAEEGEAAAAAEGETAKNPPPPPERISGNGSGSAVGAGGEPAAEAAILPSLAQVPRVAGGVAPEANFPPAQALEAASEGTPASTPLSSRPAVPGEQGVIAATAQAAEAAAGDPPLPGSCGAGPTPRSGAAFAAGDGPAEAAEAPPSPAAGKPAAGEGTAVEGGSGNARALPPEEALAGVPRGQAAEKTASGSCEPRAEGQAAASSPRPAAETSRPEHEGGRRPAAQTAAPADPHPAARARTHADSQGVAPPAVEEEATPAPGPAAEASAPAAAAKRPLPAEAHAASSPEPAAGPAESPEACAAGPRGLKAEAPLSPRAPVSPAAAAERELPGMPSRSQVFDPIVQRATLQVRGGREEIRIELKPEFLGPVRMQIATASQAVSVRILAEVPLVRDWIEAGLAQLKSELEQQGLRVERLEVAVAADGREGSARREEFRGPYAFPPASQTGSTPPIGPAHPPGWELAPGLRQAAAGPGRLDLFA